MEPTINIKEMIIIKEQKNYNIGDIVTYIDSKNNLVTHRIISKTGNKIITRGDNNTVSDIPIKKTQIEGKVKFHSIVLGEFFIYWIKPLLLLSILILLMNNIKSSNLFRRKSEEKKN